MKKRKQIKVRTFLAALKKNGYPWTKNQMYNSLDGSMCAMGQATRNLGFDPNTEEFSSLAWGLADEIYAKYKINIISFNDHARSYKDVVQYAEGALNGHDDEILTVSYTS